MGGELIHADLKGNAAADWIKISPEGYGTLDVKALLELIKIYDKISTTSGTTGTAETDVQALHQPDRFLDPLI